ncbi:MAG: peptide-methionine (R)-S-oxide reductase MsrB [Pirellulales bacterium]|nr:peptide-methionine (R)-S-oxide reductase MsrB [Pirellulales bacterium]
MAKRNERLSWTEEQWKANLTPTQFEVARRGGTEPAFSGEYDGCYRPGTYRCVCCGEALFSSETKYNSGSGWPSFYRPFAPQSVGMADDDRDGRQRVEVLCRRCGAHLGHVFEDGPPPTGLRYCINSVCLKLDESAPESPTTDS